MVVVVDRLCAANMAYALLACLLKNLGLVRVVLLICWMSIPSCPHAERKFGIYVAINVFELEM